MPDSRVRIERGDTGRLVYEVSDVTDPAVEPSYLVRVEGDVEVVREDEA